MSGAPSRLRNVLGHLLTRTTPQPPHHHQLTPTFFLERAAAIEPDAEAIYHVTANGKTLRRSYIEFADRARGFAYYLRKKGYKRVGLLAPNTPAFLESVYGIAAAGAVLVPVNIRLKPEDINYIFEFAEVDSIIVDAEYADLVESFRKKFPSLPVIVDLDTDATEGALCGPFDEAVLEGLNHDRATGAHGWSALQSQTVASEEEMIAIPFTSGTTSRPKGVVYTHRGAYLATLANVIESGLNIPNGRCKYLWTLPMYVITLQPLLLTITLPYPTKLTPTQVPCRRMDLPLGRLLRPRNPLLPTQDRLPPDLEAPQRRRNHPLQRRPHSQHPPLRSQRSRAPAHPRQGNRRRQPAHRPSLRTNDRPQLAPRACLRVDRDVRPHYTRVCPPLVGQSPCA